LGGQSMGATVTAALGPEGGLAPAERELLAAAGFRPVSLSGNVLRFETAGVAALAILGQRMGTRHSPLEAATDA
ncbi:MAG TPA: RsmE family RNA methyltransferase, partial [Gemmatimonadaceae bacterium]|nr:RsmE family RNA methyltransferase [Gemmatimonadaceae bacterium]